MFKKTALLITLLATMFLAACGNRLSGTYEGSVKQMGINLATISIDFASSDKAYLSVMGTKTEVKYSVDGKHLKIDQAGTNQILTIQDDGSILYPIPMVGDVVLTKKQ